MKKITRGLVALLLLGICVPSWALTLGDIKVQVRRHISDKADPKIKVTDAEIIAYVNEGQRDMVNRSWCLQKTYSQSLSARTTYYSLPTDLLAIQEFNFMESATGRKRALEEKSERSMYQDNPDFERQTGPPFYYFVRYSTYGATQLEYGVNPVPSTGTALGTVLIKYYDQAPDLAVSADIPLAGFRHLYPYHTALIYYAVSRIKMTHGDGGGADAYEKMYEGVVALMMDRLGRMPNYNPSFGASSSR